MNQPKEKPILFSGPMVRAILEGRKTVTRRVVKVQPFDLSWSRRDHRFGYAVGRAENGDEIDGFHAYTTRSGGDWSAKCTFGQPGDRLWVREAWAEINVAQAPGEKWIVYRECDNRTDYGGPWKPSIHMRRRDSRILLEVTAVRIERLQAITDEQAIAEGIDQDWLSDAQDRYDMVADHNFTGRPAAAGAFRYLWEGINGADSWDCNPWVWVVEFKRVMS
ncbi:hypothetical protein [Pseudomonas syringae]|nr:hypothetical protein [Pseudomonas syringae]